MNKSSLLSTSTGEEEPDGDPRPGAGGERHARQVHHPPAEEGQQLQADGRRGGLSPHQSINTNWIGTKKKRRNWLEPVFWALTSTIAGRRRQQKIIPQ